jgi:MFS family permease
MTAADLMSSTLAAAAPPAPAGPAQRSYREVWLITLGHALTHWYPATFYLLLPIIGNELGLSFSQIGLIMTCQYVAGAVANVPGGVLVDTVGRKGLLMGVSLFWVGFPYLLMSFTHSYLMLLGCGAWATACGTPRPSPRWRGATPSARASCSRCTAWVAMPVMRWRRWWSARCWR